MSLRDYLRVFRERWRLIALVLLVCLGLSVVITVATPRKYQATAQVFVVPPAASDPTQTYQATAAILSQIQTYAAVVNSKPVVDSLSQNKQVLRLGLPRGYDLAGEISAVAQTSQAIININVTDASPRRAAVIANATSASFETFIETNTRGANNRPVAKLVITQEAKVPTTPVSPRPVVNVGIGVLLGVLLGFVIAVARDVLDTRIKTLEELAKTADKPPLGVIVEDDQAERHPIAIRAGTRNIRAENFRQLRANLQFAGVDQHPRVIAVTSSMPSEGKTMVAMNLASTLAEAGFTVCLVDADLRRPKVSKLMALPGAVGLTSVLIHQIELADALQSAASNFFVLSSGPTPPNPSEMLASSAVREVVRSLLEWVDYVVLDTAPLLPVADGAEVAALADGALLVARHRTTTESQIKRAVASLRQVDSKLLGVVLNRVPATRRSEYGYSYYRADPEARAPRPERPARQVPPKRSGLELSKLGRSDSTSRIPK